MVTSTSLVNHTPAQPSAELDPPPLSRAGEGRARAGDARAPSAGSDLGRAGTCAGALELWSAPLVAGVSVSCATPGDALRSPPAAAQCSPHSAARRSAAREAASALVPSPSGPSRRGTRGCSETAQAVRFENVSHPDRGSTPCTGTAARAHTAPCAWCAARGSRCRSLSHRSLSPDAMPARRCASSGRSASTCARARTASDSAFAQQSRARQHRSARAGAGEANAARRQSKVARQSTGSNPSSPRSPPRATCPAARRARWWLRMAVARAAASEHSFAGRPA
mmetsp:Transcript_7991/g.23496  ORF Transcript_7991/g.23496 Transcript_7991/m.23496 type:complete len:281 (-) Transcript_7991:536-1378(-)